MRNIRLHWLLSSGIILAVSLLAFGLILFFVYGQDPAFDYSANVLLATKISVYGDSRTNHEVHQKIVEGILSKNPKYVFATGDLVEDGDIEDQWKTFNKITEKLRAGTKFYSALGNHEENSLLYFDNFTFPGNERWYTIDVSNTRFFILDSGSSLGADSEQYGWLKNELKAAGTKRKIIIMHHPVYNSGEHEFDELGLRSSLTPLLEKFKVRAVISGHDHDYERSYAGGIYYIVTGGGGAPLYTQNRQVPESQKFISAYHYMIVKITSNKLRFYVYGIDGNTLDQFEINK